MTSACSCAMPTSRSARRASRPPARRRRRCSSARSAVAWMALRAVLANSGCANAATGQRGLDDAAKTQGAAAMAVGRAIPTRSRSRRRARSAITCRSRRCSRASSPRGRRSSRPATRPSSRRSRRPTPREARHPGGRAARGRRSPERPVQGRRDDLAELRDDAVLRADRRHAGGGHGRSAARRLRASARSIAPRSTGSSRRTTRRS